MFNSLALTLLAAVLATTAIPQPQDHSSEQSEAQISDPNLECTVYSYAPVAQVISTQFPPIWQPASVLASDSQAQSMWANISGSIPNIAPKGQLNGSTINETYNAAADPDCWWTATQCTTPKVSGLSADVFNVPEPKTMGYAFDDGPNCTHNAFYDYLSSQNQKATLFYIGSNVADWPHEAQRGLVDGHEICAHTWSHRYMTAFASEDAFAELWYTMKMIKLVTGVTPTCWRPPYGDVDDRIRAIANALGLQTIIWHFDSNDWRVGINNVTAADVDTDYQLFINNETAGNFNSAGGIMLTHELNNFTMSEAVKWYPALKSAFSYLVPIGVALNKTQPYKETNYSLPTFQQYISGQITVAGNNNTTSSSSGSSSSPSASSSTQSGSKKSSAQALIVQSVAPWTVLSATALLAGLML
ncbi:glycoside hydrolase/deacetylase [Lactarius tabidus]|jgi:peptidoglycan/xylan/chitin deacetylase (PgdA/CDA1 family)